MDIKIIKRTPETDGTEAIRYDVYLDGEWESSWDYKNDATARVKRLKKEALN